MIHPNFSADPDFVQMLVDEAKLAVQLQHANIVQTFDLGRVDEQYYIAMELVDGADLYKLLRRASRARPRLPVRRGRVHRRGGVRTGSTTRTASATRAGGRSGSCTATSRRRTCWSPTPAR